MLVNIKQWVRTDEKKFNLVSLDDFQKYWQAKYFPEENDSTRHCEGRSLMIWEAFSSLEKLQFVSGWQKYYVKMLNDLFLA